MNYNGVRSELHGNPIQCYKFDCNEKPVTVHFFWTSDNYCITYYACSKHKITSKEVVHKQYGWRNIE